MENIKPIKRSEQLISLSREHHDALLFIWKIRQGLKNGTSISLINDYIKWFWQNHLVDHFRQEEEILLPYLLQTDPLAAQLISEHKVIRSMIDQQHDSDSISTFADILDKHVRFEERELFPQIEKNVPLDQLNEIAKKLIAHSQCDRHWGNEFWKSKI